MRGRFAQLGDAEVNNLYHHLARLSLGQENVVGLEIAMDDSQLVRGIQAVGGLLKDVRAFV